MKDPMAQVAAQMLAALIASPAGKEYVDAYITWSQAFEGAPRNSMDIRLGLLRDDLADEAFRLARALEQAHGRHLTDDLDEFRAIRDTK